MLRIYRLRSAPLSLASASALSFEVLLVEGLLTRSVLDRLRAKVMQNARGLPCGFDVGDEADCTSRLLEHRSGIAGRGGCWKAIKKSKKMLPN